MNIRKDSGPLKWILIGISVLFLFVMLILPLSYVMYTAFSKGIKVFQQFREYPFGNRYH